MAITFKGGLHPLENKHHSERKSIVVLPVPELVYVHVWQHLGAPAKAIVKKGDEVKYGQKIAEAAGFISANIHSPVSGKVVKIDDIPHPLGDFAPAIVIENDGRDTPAGELTPHTEWDKLSPGDIVKIVRDSGVVGMGGATFPTNVKLSPPKDKPIHTLIFNGAECEPYLTADHRLMLENATEIVEGVKIIAYTLGVKRTIIAIEDNKPDAVRVMSKAASRSDIEVIAVKTKYPQGAEKQLINALTGLEVPSGGLPFDIGCYVQNVATAMAVRDTVIDGKPLVDRITTVSGSIVIKPQNFNVRVGTPISQLLDAAGGTKVEIGKIIMGGPMMGNAAWTLDIPVSKGTSGVLFFPVEDAQVGRETPCILCSKCIDICPMRLMPTTIASNAQFEKIEEAKKLGALDCIECGSCSYICPANRNLLHYIRWAKSEIRKMEK